MLDARVDGARLHVSVCDDGSGGVDQAGSGISGLRDRVEALGGTFTIESDPGRGTFGICWLPAAVPDQPSW
jgi:signal transduction histidine kinase